MHTVNMHEAKSRYSRLVDNIEQGRVRVRVREVIIAHNGRPAAKLVAIDARPAAARIGITKGAFEVPDDIDKHNAEVARLFMGTAPA